MDKKITIRRIRRTKRTRAKIFGTDAKPRLAVFRSNKYFYLQLIDDEAKHTLISASTQELQNKSPVGATKTEQANQLGGLLAKKALEAGIKTAVFDRRFYRYHGRVKAAAEGVRTGGLII